MDATWQMLGRAAGTEDVGVNRVRVAPGKLPTPPHSHGASEEIFYRPRGLGPRLAGRRGARGARRRLRDPPADHHEHTFVAGPDGLEYLVFGTRHPTEIGWLPRSRAIRIGWPWVEGRDDDPWDIEAAGPPLEVGDARAAAREHRQHRRGRARALGRQGSDRTARDARALRPRRLPLGAPQSGQDRLGAALPLRGGGDLRHPRRLGDAASLALPAPRGARRRTRAARAAAGARRRPAPGSAGLALFQAGDEG